MAVIKVGEENFDSEVKNSEKTVVVDFNADWCGPCRMLKPILEKLSEERKDVKFVSVNIDDEEGLAEEFGIYSIPCLVLFKKGEETGRNVGFIQREELIKFIGE